MKILHLIYTEAVAGAEKYLLNLLPGLKPYGIECSLICVCPKRSEDTLIPYCNTIQESGINTLLLTGSKKNFISISKAINKYLVQENISIIHSHLSNADVLAVLVKLLFNKKIFIISSKHGYDERYLVKYSAEAKPAQIEKNLYYYYTQFLLKKIDVNLATSKGIADLYFNIKLSNKKYHFIHHGIQPIKIDSKENVQGIQLIIVGRLEKVKGHKFLLDALVQVLKVFSNVTLIILGNGSQKDNLIKQAREAGIEKQITFLDFRVNPYNIISSSDIVIQPSSFESFGLVYIEAFALKVPVIAFDVPAANEIIDNSETGILVQKFNSEMLAQKIIYLIQNPDERNRISENAYKKFLHYYTADRMVRETAFWYKSLNLHTR